MYTFDLDKLPKKSYRADAFSMGDAAFMVVLLDKLGYTPVKIRQGTYGYRNNITNNFVPISGGITQEIAGAILTRNDSCRLNRTNRGWHARLFLPNEENNPTLVGGSAAQALAKMLVYHHLVHEWAFLYERYGIKSVGKGIDPSRYNNLTEQENENQAAAG